MCAFRSNIHCLDRLFTGSTVHEVAHVVGAAMDSVKLNQEGVAPIKAELEAICQSFGRKRESS